MDWRNSFNDSPISLPKEDLFGINPFAQALAKSIKGFEAPVGVTIAINGKWGSGKSSAINLIRHHLERDEPEEGFKIVNFNCWWFRGEEELTLSYFQELYAAMKPNLPTDKSRLITRLGKKMLQCKPVIGPAVSLIAGGAMRELAKGGMELVENLIEKSESVERLFGDLQKALRKNDHRYLIIIDDIDRLTPEEALLIFRLIKSVGQLPNVIYLLAFDRELAEKVVSENYPAEGPHFLEKIIQACFDLPTPILFDIEKAILNLFKQIDDQEIDLTKRHINRIMDNLFQFIKFPRDINRLLSALSVTWLAVKNDVHFIDFVAIEAIRLFEPLLFSELRNSKELIFNKQLLSKKEEQFGQELDRLCGVVSEEKRERARSILLSLFPRFRAIETSSEAQDGRRADRKICTSEHFDTYFRWSVGLDALPRKEVDRVIEYGTNTSLVKKEFIEAAKTKRQDGSVKIFLLLTELRINADRISEEATPGFISAIFEIADEVDNYQSCINAEFDPETNIYLQIYRFVSELLLKKFNIKIRSNIIRDAIQKAGVGWLVYLAISANDDYYPARNHRPEPVENCLISIELLPKLIEFALKSLRTAAKKGVLINHPRLEYILYRWIDFLKILKIDISEVVEWTNSQIDKPDTLVKLAKALLGEIRSYGVDDRVVSIKPRISINGIDKVVDVNNFRKRLKKSVSDDRLDQQKKAILKTFLEIWKNQEEKDDL